MKTPELEGMPKATHRRRWRLAGYCVSHVTSKGAFGVMDDKKITGCLVNCPVPDFRSPTAWSVGLFWNRHFISTQAKKALNRFRKLIKNTVARRTEIFLTPYAKDPLFFCITKLGKLTINRVEEDVITGKIRMRKYEDERMLRKEIRLRKKDAERFPSFFFQEKEAAK